MAYIVKSSAPFRSGPNHSGPWTDHDATDVDVTLPDDHVCIRGAAERGVLVFQPGSKVSGVAMSNAFQYTSYLSLKGLHNIDTSGVQYFNTLFTGYGFDDMPSETIEPISYQEVLRWDVCNARNVSSMFNQVWFDEDPDFSRWGMPWIPSFSIDGMLGSYKHGPERVHVNRGDSGKNAQGYGNCAQPLPPLETPELPRPGVPNFGTSSYGIEVIDCSTTIGTVTMSGPDTECKDTTSTYTVNNTGDATDITYQWSTTDNLATIASPTAYTTQVTFRTEGDQTLTCRLTSATASDTPKTVSKVVTVDDCVVDPCDGVTCGPNEYCDNGVCKPVDPCAGVTCGPDEVCVNGICEPKPPQSPGSDEFHYRYPNHYFTSRQDTAITTRDTQELNDYEKGIGRTETVDRTLDKKIILPPDFNPNP